MPFDQENGLVYAESVMKADDHMRCSRAKYKMHLLELPGLPTRGAGSLLVMAKRTFFQNMDKLDISSLQDLPQPVIQQLWRWTNESGAVSLHAWQVFASTGLLNREDDFPFKLACMMPACLARFATSPNMAWLVDLAIGDVSMNTEDMISLSKIPNLRTLHLRRTMRNFPQQTYMSDRILRAWALVAKNSGALSKLQLLFIDGQRDVTTRTLQYLGHFPALQMFTAFDCGICCEDIAGKEQDVAGWRLDNLNPLQRLIVEKPTRFSGKSPPQWPTLVRMFIADFLGVYTSSQPVLRLLCSKSTINRAGQRVCEDDFNDTIFSFQRDPNYRAVAREATAQPVAKRRRLRGNVAAANYELMTGNG
ncbi:hypothetical protein CERZMDRAFT_97839 [Cercospora zeae-maydis SCOH1-5]|uniref:F-box domain-containing protein n=1 Tax=Cercospora zeae-maydis SCOH1-5 TaxID=717836 RepID=A0A6A6FEJ7_9PEZI|nr:hypothetical protein CERZMDRAFT_97839 [Cercospora zeae-maydis SCOH1-5]